MKKRLSIMSSKFVDMTSIMQVIGCVYNQPQLLDYTDKYAYVEEICKELNNLINNFLFPFLVVNSPYLINNNFFIITYTPNINNYIKSVLSCQFKINYLKEMLGTVLQKQTQ